LGKGSIPARLAQEKSIPLKYIVSDAAARPIPGAIDPLVFS
jgi:hypothetical protein